MKGAEAVGTTAVNGAAWVAGKAASTARKIGSSVFNAVEAGAGGVAGAIRAGGSLAGKAVGGITGSATIAAGGDVDVGPAHPHVPNNSAEPAHYHLYYDGKKENPLYKESLTKYG